MTAICVDQSLLTCDHVVIDDLNRCLWHINVTIKLSSHFVEALWDMFGRS
jgi:hypothetical protein